MRLRLQRCIYICAWPGHSHYYAIRVCMFVFKYVLPLLVSVFYPQKLGYKLLLFFFIRGNLFQPAGAPSRSIRQTTDGE